MYYFKYKFLIINNKKNSKLGYSIRKTKLD